MNLNDIKEVDSILRYIDGILRHGHFEKCDALLKDSNVEEMNVYQILSILTATLPARGILKNRPDFYERAKIRIKKLYPDNWEKQLMGLEELPNEN